MGDLFQLMGTLVLITAGSTGCCWLRWCAACAPCRWAAFRCPHRGSAKVLVPLLSGSFFAALELAAPVLAATILVEISVALLGKLSPQLPVISLTVPLKTLTGFVLLIGSLALWPRFIEGRFSSLLDVAERLIAPVPGGRG
jgi:flagellar biosynthetic protein FliR